MAQTATSSICSLVLRIFTLVLLLISLIVLTTNTKTIEVSDGSVRLRFSDVYSYKYVLAAIVFGTAYTLLQVGLSVFKVINGSDSNILFDFYGDKIMSYMLATGAAAGFGVTADMKQLFDASELYFHDFYDKAYASCSMLFFAFVCTAVLSVLSSYALPRST
ncbi:CASP-like protein 4D1 [Ziziphus jujuba]|uniref:CASP-like protein n=1 Tax=Ziziphus jujuba TaxID=326968 RepID=A0ABM3IEH7_ZIZJJ|nr:CASP-like protein 4D1 [Ziziphus jujuba]